MKQKHIDMYMRMAGTIAEASSSIRLKVGSVLVKNNNVISTGYNALPAHIDGPLEIKYYMEPNGWIDQEEILENWPYKDDKGRYKLVTKPEVRHSEKNALIGLIKSNESSIGATLFCTHACCKFCAIDIVDAGIVSVFYRNEYRTNEGIKYLEANNIEVKQWKN